MISISYLFERRRITYNAPELAWSVYNNAEPPDIPGWTDAHAVRKWNGIDIDAEIPIQSIKSLNSIPNIKIRATCQGHTNVPGIPDVNSYMVFTPNTQDKKYINNLISKLNKYKDIKAGYAVGRLGFFRVAVVASFSFDSNQREFKKWWINLPNIIKKEL